MAYSTRELFRGTLAGAATAAFAGVYQRPLSAQTSLTPEAALQQLIDGNGRFAEGRMTSFNEDLNVLRAKTVDKQEPFAAVLSCADSRVPVELIFDHPSPVSFAGTTEVFSDPEGRLAPPPQLIATCFRGRSWPGSRSAPTLSRGRGIRLQIRLHDLFHVDLP